MASRSALSFLVCASLAGPVRAQKSAPANPPGPNQSREIEYVDPDVFVPGRVLDLARDAQGRILYCTAEGTVGRIVPGSAPTVLASEFTGPFPNELRAVAETPAGDVAVVDEHGDVRVLVGAATPAVLEYDDEYMIQDATDLIVDAQGNFLIASSTPSNGERGINWISSDGTRWSYYLVRHAPVQLAHDPLTGGIVISGATGGGELQLVTAGSEIRATTPMDTATHPGLSSAQDDGDLAAEADGDLYWIAGGSIYLRSRGAGTTTLFQGGLGQLRGIVIAASSGHFPSATGWSLYVAEGQSPTQVREFTGVGAPGAVTADGQGFVPGRGQKIDVIFGFQAFDLALDNSGRLLLGGSEWSTTHYVKRVTLTPSPSIATLATSADGLTGIVEGLCVAEDDAIYALTRPGTIHRITEGPLSVTSVFTDPLGQITAGKDLALDVDGTFYVGTRESWDFGKLLEISGGVAALLATTEETRGLAADPTGGLFLTQWHNVGFHGTVDRYSFSGGSLASVPGFAGMNYTNDSVWGDGDLCVDADGSVYTVAEDEWSLVRYDPDEDGFVRIGSGYLNHPSGLVIAPSTSGSGSTTGWSLYVSEFDFLWEKPSVQPPASTLVDSSSGLTADSTGRTLAGAPDPRYGRPRAIARSPGAFGGAGILIATSQGWVLGLDPRSGTIEPVAGPEQGLHGDLVALASAPRGGRVLVLDRAGEVFELSGRSVRRLATHAERLPLVVQHFLERPQQLVRLPVTGSRGADWFALEGWVVWRAAIE